MTTRPLWMTGMASVLAAVLLPGCGIFSTTEYRAARTFDLGVPPAETATPYAVEVLPFQSETSGRYKMQFRLSGHQLAADEYNRWTLTPSAMITNYLRIDFAKQNGDAAGGFTVSGAVLGFEADTANNVCRLFVRYTVTTRKSDTPLITRTVLLEEPLRGNDQPAAFAEAMSRAAFRLATDIRASMNAKHQAVEKATK